MEVFEQIRLLIILIMAALSYHYVSNQPLAITSSDEEQEESQAEPDQKQLIQEPQEQQPPQTSIQPEPEEPINAEENVQLPNNKEATTQPVIDGQEVPPIETIEGEEEESVQVLNEVEQNEEEEEGS